MRTQAADATLFFWLLVAVRAQSACERGWKDYDGSCYFFSTEVSSYQTAHGACLKKDAHLVSIHSEGENLFVSSHVAQRSVFVGADYSDVRRPVNTDNTAWDFQFHYCGASCEPGREDTTAKERPVVTVLKADMWKNYFCEAHKGFICTAEPEECKEDDGCVTARCPPLYQSGGNLAPCIFLSQQTATWDEANDTCVRMEGRMAFIDTADKHERLMKDLSGDFSPLASDISIPELWIGVRLDETWVNGSGLEPKAFTRWYPTYPEEGTGECVAMIPSTWHIEGVITSTHYGYVCKKPQPKKNIIRVVAEGVFTSVWNHFLGWVRVI
ncbi:unnamed protein product [Darwinula stevensoni]|uniref:C-type lectin domain-containing protein n=1 Tax=Darwinula stevensoni TaxID=69355 RepID=A0A7R9A2W4_9CRUS|nr:unnamed protein product [Darwinula stevensoni]CAG0880789.1 unnamed protein product [Darwinula stevensoni]